MEGLFVTYQGEIAIIYSIILAVLIVLGVLIFVLLATLHSKASYLAHSVFEAQQTLEVLTEHLQRLEHLFDELRRRP